MVKEGGNGQGYKEKKHTRRHWGGEQTKGGKTKRGGKLRQGVKLKDVNSPSKGTGKKDKNW